MGHSNATVVVRTVPSHNKVLGDTQEREGWSSLGRRREVSSTSIYAFGVFSESPVEWEKDVGKSQLRRYPTPFNEED